jgi:citrate synthase
MANVACRTNMETGAPLKNTGLRGFTVADTGISVIDGKEGILIYRGYRIEDLADRSSFDETAYLLLNGALPNREQHAKFSDSLKSARRLPDFIMAILDDMPKSARPLDVLQASLPLLGAAKDEPSTQAREADVRRAIRILGAMTSLIAAWHRLQSGLDPVAPDPDLDHADNFLRQLNGVRADPELSRALDISMLLQAEHTFNASTFACREVASTGAHMYAAVAAAVGALSGELHGGANARVIELLLKMEEEGRTEEDIARWTRERLNAGKRIMGMGHAVYKTFDPRATILKSMCRTLSRKLGFERRFQLLSTIEEVTVLEFEKRGKPQIKANVDFYSGLLYSMMGIPVDLMTAVFAMSLACGWCAHFMEERYGEAGAAPVPYEPSASYIGDYCGPVGCKFIPLEER